ncbi:GyrI-like domain-containing protein [Roseiarcaceae bacterium H3SJ34-1]|uniref:GyrI-like domain-containing protein n=1 Tax=Terripilifer ovatus TaxID=3032367 RepID=UPI003AB9A7AA|nr:GyrI-like domain-containing protein [Roseiarcaceae bacterium H3SJ34-1]
MSLIAFKTTIASRIFAGLALAAMMAAAPVGFAAAQTPPSSTPATPAAPAVPAPAAPDSATPNPAAPNPATPGADTPSVGDSSTSSVVAVELSARPALSYAGKSDWDDGYKTIMDAIAKLRAEAARAGLKPIGHPLTVFLSTDDAGFRFEAMLPLDAPPADAKVGSDFKVSQTPAGKAIKFEHRGSYEEIESTYEAITAWLDEKNLDSRDLFIEEYLNDAKGSDDTDLQVDVYVFVK